jgi:hypothetical protein
MTKKNIPAQQPGKKEIHVECKPDELLVSKFGFTRKLVTHHTGKSRVFSKMRLVQHTLALVDEDPGTAKTTYEKQLILVAERHGIKKYEDKNGNSILVLSGKLEDWIVSVCRQAEVNLKDYGLPAKPDDLHEVINQRLNQFGELIIHLLQAGNPAIATLKGWLE